MTKLIGSTNPYQIPTAGDLGSLAFQDSQGVTLDINTRVKSGFAARRPVINFDFVNSRRVDGTLSSISPTARSVTDANGYVRRINPGVGAVDHDPWTGECLGFKSERACTNIINQFGQDGLTITANTTDLLAPDGTFTAYKMVETSVNSQHNFYPQATGNLTNGTEYIFSMYVKPNNLVEMPYFILSVHAGPQITLYFNSDYSNYTDRGVQKLPNGWYRVWGKFTGGGYSNVYATAATLGGYQGTAGTRTWYAWGWQVEQSFTNAPYSLQKTPSNLVPSWTSGSTSTANANGLLYYESGSSGHRNKAYRTLKTNPSEGGAVFIEFTRPERGGYLTVLESSNNSAVDYVEMGVDVSRAGLTIRKGNSLLVNEWNTVPIQDVNRYCLTWSLKSIVVYFNGRKFIEYDRNQNDPWIFPSLLNSVHIGYYAENTTPGGGFHGYIRKWQMYNTKLSNEELEFMTSF